MSCIFFLFIYTLWLGSAKYNFSIFFRMIGKYADFWKATLGLEYTVTSLLMFTCLGGVQEGIPIILQP